MSYIQTINCTECGRVAKIKLEKSDTPINLEEGQELCSTIKKCLYCHSLNIIVDTNIQTGITASCFSWCQPFGKRPHKNPGGLCKASSEQQQQIHTAPTEFPHY